MVNVLRAQYARQHRPDTVRRKHSCTLFFAARLYRPQPCGCRPCDDQPERGAKKRRVRDWVQDRMGRGCRTSCRAFTLAKLAAEIYEGKKPDVEGLILLKTRHFYIWRDGPGKVMTA